MKYWPAIGLLALLQGCAGTLPAELAQDATRGPEASAYIDELPFFPQDEYQCGPAALATMLAHNGLAVLPEDLIAEVFVPGRKGSFQYELAASARRHEQLAYPLQGGLNALLDELDAGHPVLVLQNLGLSWYPQWHYAVVRGYDLQQRKLILNSGTLENYRLALGTFARTWARAEHWGLIIAAPGQLPVTAVANGYFSAILPQLSGTGSASTAIQQQLLQAGLERWPEHLELLMARGNQLYAQGKLHEALQDFERAASFHPDYAYAWNNQAVVAAELGLREQALAALVKARTLAPEDDPVVAATWKELKGESNQ